MKRPALQSAALRNLARHRAGRCRCRRIDGRAACQVPGTREAESHAALKRVARDLGAAR